MQRITIALFLSVFTMNSYALPAEQSDSAISVVKLDKMIGSTKTEPSFDDSELNKKVTSRTLSSTQNSTYIKCTYRLDNDPTNPGSSWMWAKYPPQPDSYAIVYGYWRDNQMSTNMFYTKASAQHLEEICKFTLRQAGVNSDFTLPYAGDSFFSYYYNFWSQGSNLPEADLAGIKLDRMVIFGDSLSDNINVYNATRGVIPQNMTWFYGRFSNGLLWHEYWTKDKLHIPGYVWATANAESNFKPLFPGFTEQLDNFKNYITHADGYDIKKTLFIVLFGGNDFITGNKVPDDIINAYRNNLGRLAQMGAGQVAILNLPDFSGIPAVRNWSAADKQALKEKSALFNIKLEALVKELQATYSDTRFVTLSLDKAFSHLHTHAAELGFVNTTETCLDIKGDKAVYAYYYSPREACKNSAGKYIYWDPMHPTTYTYSQLSEMLFDELVTKLQAQAAE
ncbi:SGNH/GDSL hydrolase family protein [Mixta intestinalis]|uniref:Thermolabile hemolysin n=1 Tax=Mixta intestinalis TaxID=1615494 RepID=A0A6P1Q364_9GAMM|nr:SGNH/GDSL hydrolase family protein [Mixta intestinalis]QHM73356.1 Thermolabile hemolysin [Mixta intestinalis]